MLSQTACISCAVTFSALSSTSFLLAKLKFTFSYPSVSASLVSILPAQCAQLRLFNVKEYCFKFFLFVLSITSTPSSMLSQTACISCAVTFSALSSTSFLLAKLKFTFSYPSVSASLVSILPAQCAQLRLSSVKLYFIESASLLENMVESHLNNFLNMVIVKCIVNLLALSPDFYKFVLS